MSRARPDLSTKLVHLTKGESFRDSFNVLLTIMQERKLRGGSGKIKGKHICVCFTEAPLAQLALSLAQRDLETFKYRAMGVMFDKKWALDQGARPAIYQPDDEYNILPDAIKYRHVRYDNEVDFTWEREWRLRADELPFEPKDVTMIVPDRGWADLLIDAHQQSVVEKVEKEGASAITRYPWHIVALADLGIEIPDSWAEVEKALGAG